MNGESCKSIFSGKSERSRSCFLSQLCFYLYEWLFLQAWISFYYFHTFGYRAVGQTLPAPMDEYGEYSGESRGFSDGTLRSSVVWGKKAHILLLYLFDGIEFNFFVSLECSSILTTPKYCFCGRVTITTQTTNHTLKSFFSWDFVSMSKI